MMRDEFTAWAVKLGTPYGFAGRYFWFGKIAPQIPAQLEGCQTALFKTRALARKAAKQFGREYYQPSVVKVKVTVETLTTHRKASDKKGGE
jgi:hypothetical protein